MKLLLQSSCRASIFSQYLCFAIFARGSMWRPPESSVTTSYYLQCRTTTKVVSYDQVTTSKVVTDDHVTTVKVVSDDHVTTAKVVRDDHVTTPKVVNTTTVRQPKLSVTTMWRPFVVRSRSNWRLGRPNWRPEYVCRDWSDDSSQDFFAKKILFLASCLSCWLQKGVYTSFLSAARY